MEASEQRDFNPEISGDQPEDLPEDQPQDQPQDQPEDQPYLYEEEGLAVIQGQFEHEQITPEPDCEYTAENDSEYEDLAAVDLRTSRVLDNLRDSAKQNNQLKCSQKESISIAQLIENFHYNDSSGNRNSPRYFLITTPSSRGEYSESSHDMYEENNGHVITDYSADQNNQQSVYQNGYQTRWDAGTSTEPIMKTDQETQTWRETREVSVQTDTFMYSSKKNTKPSDPFSCPLCQRFYASKSSYDRHLRTHNRNQNSKIITDVRFTTQAKLQVYKNSHMGPAQLENPLVIQMPRKSYMCNICERHFSSQVELISHQCIVAPFPMTKCPHCPVKCYTLGALNEHIKNTHKPPNTPGSSQYHCIFCNESFVTGYDFHLHLDKHLSP